VIAPETIVCDHGKAYLSATFRTAFRLLGINLQPAHPDTPTDKPVEPHRYWSAAASPWPPGENAGCGEVTVLGVIGSRMCAVARARGPAPALHEDLFRTCHRRDCNAPA
jgi:hypothetical protein